jgi:hypothetical protein
MCERSLADIEAPHLFNGGKESYRKARDQIAPSSKKSDHNRWSNVERERQFSSQRDDQIFKNYVSCIIITPSRSIIIIAT